MLWCQIRDWRTIFPYLLPSLNDLVDESPGGGEGGDSAYERDGDARRLA